jgi:hypothetical protein
MNQAQKEKATKSPIIADSKGVSHEQKMSAIQRARMVLAGKK